MERKPLFRVGEQVRIVKPLRPRIEWDFRGNMLKLVGEVRTIIRVTNAYCNVSNDGSHNDSWAFSFDCLEKLEQPEPMNSNDDEDDDSEYVIDAEGEKILLEDAVETSLDGWVHVDRVVTAEDGETMHESTVHDHGYRYDHRGDLHQRDDLYYVRDTQEYHHSDEMGETFFYHQRDDEYYSYEPDEEERHGYQNGPRHNYSDGAKFRFGVEVEKEDRDPIDNYSLSDVDYTGWARECDGSLDDESGYELVSPMFDLFGDRFDTQVNSDILSEHINADYSSNCGGHIGFSISGKTGVEAFDLYNGFFPLLFSMYRHRLNGTWSKLRTNNNFKRQREKYSAVNVRHGYIEFRIFSAVKNVTNLLWRRDLLRIMAKNPKKGVMWWLNQAINPNSALHNHLLKVYSVEKINLVCAYAAAIAERMNGRKYVDLIRFADEDAKHNAKRFVNNL
jgi:hypothetical protein